MIDNVDAVYRNSPVRYGRISRFFHWIMAYLLVWQILMFVGWRVLSEDCMRSVSHFGPSHSLAGSLILLLVVPRALWAISGRRPPPAAGVLGSLAQGLHGMLYVLMFTVPAVAILRAYGNGKGLALGTMQLIPATGREVGVLVKPADLAHAPLGWALAILVSGHIMMALLHHFVGRDGTLNRMVGRLPRQD
jgi:cytochrome b561